MLFALGIKADDGKYGKPFVPMMPGMRALAGAVKQNLIKPHLKEAGGDALFAADLGSESFMGASNYAAAMSNGRLSAGISPGWMSYRGFEPEDATVLSKVNEWCEAARVLRGGIVGRIDDPEILEAAGWRGVAWTLWPAPVFDDFNEPGARMLKAKLADNIRRKMDKDRAGFAYLGEDLFILALADRHQGEFRDLIESGLKLLTHDAAFPGTDCFGEVTMWGDFAGTGERIAQQRTAIPHIWSGVTVYLAALALYEPELFDGQRPPAP